MGKTVTTYLIDGNPKGTQYVLISNKICEMMIVPRSDLSIVNTRTEFAKPAFYILLGESEKLTPQAYIGETESFRERVKDHDNKKDFWQKALVFISKDESMTKVDVQYLEYLGIGLARKSKQFSLEENKQIPKEPNLPEYQKDNMNEFFEDIKFLTSFIGCNILDIGKTSTTAIFYLKVKDCDARGYYDNSGFTVLEGSIIAPNNVKSLKGKEKRIALIEEFCKKDGENLILNSSKTFSSPSGAATFCDGRTTNGWKDWKDKDGNSLDTIYRKI